MSRCRCAGKFIEWEDQADELEQTLRTTFLEERAVGMLHEQYVQRRPRAEQDDRRAHENGRPRPPIERARTANHAAGPPGGQI